ncbi:MULTISPECIES: hypothetical protein [unclassified Lysinibacillus]|uniref:hypothetical protein n=1 Tax=unclassified Lysinibacillus TaxID=2636778 RepID=UPI00382C85FB
MSYNQVVGSEVIFRRVIQLAENREFEDRNINIEKVPEMINLLELEKSMELDAPLLEYLKSLSFDEIKMIQVVMHLGRGKYEDQPIGAKEIYEDQLERLFDGKDSETKEIKINIIIEKVPLARFLRTGLSLLDVKIDETEKI